MSSKEESASKKRRNIGQSLILLGGASSVTALFLKLAISEEHLGVFLLFVLFIIGILLIVTGLTMFSSNSRTNSLKVPLLGPSDNSDDDYGQVSELKVKKKAYSHNRSDKKAVALQKTSLKKLSFKPDSDAKRSTTKISLANRQPISL